MTSLFDAAVDAAADHLGVSREELRNRSGREGQRHLRDARTVVALAIEVSSETRAADVMVWADWYCDAFARQICAEGRRSRILGGGLGAAVLKALLRAGSLPALPEGVEAPRAKVKVEPGYIVTRINERVSHWLAAEPDLSDAEIMYRVRNQLADRISRSTIAELRAKARRVAA